MGLRGVSSHCDSAESSPTEWLREGGMIMDSAVRQTIEELREIAHNIYLEYRTSTGSTYGEINRRYTEAQRAVEEAKKEG